MTVSIVDYGLGNLGSVANMLKRVGTKSRRVTSPDELLESDRVLLPGVGSFDAGMSLLEATGLADGVRRFAASGRPLLGICLGMQLLLEGSEEGSVPGLGLVPGRSVRFESSQQTRVPHMGWSRVLPAREDRLLFGLPTDNRFYFVHSYRVVPDHPEDTLATTDYGVTFTSMIRSENIAGAQFHPEKSHTFGMTILRNFATQ